MRAADRTALLALSNERDQWEKREDAAYRAGYAAGLELADAAYRTGLADALLAIKRINRGLVGDLKSHLAMWGGRPRGRFADPQPGDYPGTEARRAAS